MAEGHAKYADKIEGSVGKHVNCAGEARTIHMCPYILIVG